MIEETLSDSNNISSLSENNIEELPTINNTPPIKFERDENGLLKHIQYKFTPDGFVDWRGMVLPEHLYIKPDNKPKLEKKYNKKFEELTVNDVEDTDLVILLAGIKRIASLRGFSSVKYRPIIAKNDFVATVCSIKWLPNFETEEKEVEFEAMANASLDNSNEMTKIYLPETAENRAFVRAVRSFLKISVVSREELANSYPPPSEAKKEIKAHDLLLTLMGQKNMTFEQLKAKMIHAKMKNADKYNSVEEIPTNLVFEVLERMKALVIKKENKSEEIKADVKNETTV